jgi:hypothetical protein
LAPDAKEQMEEWLAHTASPAMVAWGRMPVWERAIVFGAMGRPSVEADVMIRRRLTDVDSYNAEDLLKRDWDTPTFLRWWCQQVTQFGVGGRLAIPYLERFLKHPNPLVRMWAAEALEEIRGHRVPQTGPRSAVP